VSGEPVRAAPAAPARFITVGIPVHDGRALLRACLASVVGSDFPHERYEVVVCDDGSTEPETLAILRELEQTHAGEPGFVRVLRLPENSGGAARPRNRILDEATGEYVFFVDADDTIGPEALRRVADALAETPADWVGLHQALVNGRRGAMRVRRARQEVPRSKAFSSLTVHKVFRRAEIERQRLRFDEGLPSGQDVAFAFAFILAARRFLVLGDYDYYFLTGHSGDASEPPHLSRSANTVGRLLAKNHRILTSMLADLGRSPLPLDERLAVLGDVALPRVLVQQRQLGAVVAAGRRAGRRELRRLSELLASDALARRLDPDRLTKSFTAEHLEVVRSGDWLALRDLVHRRGETVPGRLTPLGRGVERARHLLDVGTGRVRHRRVMDELDGLREAVEDLRASQARLADRLEDALGERRRPSP
jgi:glycosyltransferase involved in cell wall biosynthesis